MYLDSGKFLKGISIVKLVDFSWVLTILKVIDSQSNWNCMGMLGDIEIWFATQEYTNYKIVLSQA